MSTEVRKTLEKELQAAFALTASSHPNLKASKNKLGLFSSNQKLGEIYIQHLRTADGYYAGIELYTCEALDFCTMQQPPYPSRLLNSSFMSQSSLSEQTKQFGDELGGVIRTPPPQEISATTAKINDRIAKFYLPKAENCILGTHALIADVIAEPDSYAYPLLTGLFAARKNKLDLNSLICKELLNTKAVFGDKRFDLALAKEILKVRSNNAAC